MTIKELYDYAVRHAHENAQIRICDGMAVSFYPDGHCIGLAPMEIVIDVSCSDMVDYDELPNAAKRVVYADDWYCHP